MNENLQTFWDGELMHLANRIQLKHGYSWVKICVVVDIYPRGQPREGIPTCLKCLAEAYAPDA